jgi:hypothetical protein
MRCKCHCRCGTMGALVGTRDRQAGQRAVKISQAKDQARSAARPQPSSDLQPEDADEPTPAADRFASRAADAVPIDRSRRRWTVRVHWGIVFAIVASLILWFAIKSAVDLAF